MRYLIAVLVPPVAVLLCGKPFQAVLSVLLSLCFYVPGQIHACLVVHSHLADQRADRIVRAVRA